MKLLQRATLLLAAIVFCSADSNDGDSLSSKQILPMDFKPPQIFKNTNVMRNINLEKSYVKETTIIVFENIDKEPHTEYYIPFEADTIGKVGGFVARDKNDAEKPPFQAEVVEYDANSPTQFYRITFHEPIAPKSQLTLHLTYHILDSLKPLPANIGQQEPQFLSFKFSEYAPSSYFTAKQKTKVKFPTATIPDYTGKPDRQGSTFTYGAFEKIPAGAESFQTVRYEFQHPVIYTSRLERDVEISHWGGNAAFEERYWLTNKAANLTNQFSRVIWTQQSYMGVPISAIKQFRIPLKAGSVDAYYTDEIGNISTSNFRTNKRESMLELKPRYPVFGGWNFPFVIGWNAPLSKYLRATQGEGYILNIPFLEGPKMSEGISYEKITLNVILPEGAINVNFQTSVPLVDVSQSSHKTFMDTLGRTKLTLTAMNIVDELRDESIVVIYDYPFMAGFRKPLTIFGGVLTLFATSWLISRTDTSIGKKQ